MASDPSSAQVPAASTAATDPDVVILGGGLAGLTLSIQLRRQQPGTRVLVLERRSHPVPVAAHKVGESTVEIGAHYFEHVLGLGEHLRQAQLRKFGFRFFFSHGRADIDQVTELGASRPLPTPSYQIDRGVFENFLGQHARSLGVTFVDGCRVHGLKLGTAGDLHHVSWTDADGASHHCRARWVVDACGRAGIIKRQLGLARENAHAAHAVWFRMAHRITLDDWSDNPAWRARCETPTRWLSTIHLVGPGYWVWLIPLASGSHSVGIVADPRWQPLEEMNTFERAMQWLHCCQPRLAQALEPQRHTLQDFAFFRRFSFDCTQVFSTDRWALAGEAGRFLDPFYSPGSDFIAMGNTYICELVKRDLAGLRIHAHVQVYEQLMRSFYDNTLRLYQDQYGIFGDALVMPHKVLWDYTYYWGVLAPLACHNRLTDLQCLAQLRGALQAAQDLNTLVQEVLREWSCVRLPGQAQAPAHANPAVMLDQASMPWFVELNRSLQQPMEDAAFRSHLRAGIARMHTLARQLVEMAGGPGRGPQAHALHAWLAQAGSGDPPDDTCLLFPALSGLKGRQASSAAPHQHGQAQHELQHQARMHPAEQGVVAQVTKV